MNVTVRLTDLNPDVLRSIIDNDQLFAVSLTCKKLRSVTIPFLFREIVWDEARRSDSISASVLAYVRRFRLRHASSLRYIPKLLSSMPQLSHFIFDCDQLSHHPTSVMNTLCRIPSLVALEFLQTSLAIFTSKCRVPDGLQRIVIKDANIIRQDGGIGINNAASDLTDYDMMEKEWRRGVRIISSGYQLERSRRVEKDSQASVMFNRLLQSTLLTLQHLEFEVSLLPPYPISPLQLPQLRVLVLYGRAYSTSDKPFMPLLRGIPSLEDLQILLHQDDGGTGGFLLGPYPYHGEPTTEEIASAHPSLRSLTLSNSVYMDSIFFLLPSSVRRVSLPQYGEGDERMGWTPDEDHLIQIIKAISRSKASLTELQITARDVPSTSFVQQVVSLLPQLCTLTVTRPHLTFKDFQHEEDDKKANVLRSLQQLEFPRLESFYLTEYPDEQLDGRLGVPPNPRRGRLDLVFRTRPRTFHDSYVPFQCRHTSPEVSLKELQWGSCFHDISSHHPADVQIWWHAGACVEQSNCLCSRSKYPTGYAVHNALHPRHLDMNVNSGYVAGVLKRLSHWFIGEER